MKHIGVVGVLALGLWLLMGESVWAQSAAPPASQATAAQQRAWGPAFVDANGDGICDNLAQGSRGMGRGRAAGGGRGPAFVDADGDGVCDNLAQAGAGYGRGRGAAGRAGRWRR